MPYINGQRVSNEEWTRINGSITQLHTGPNGENPAEAPEVDASTGAPKQKKGKAGGKRSQRSESAAKAAVADALGVAPDAAALADIDVSGLDLDASSTEQEQPA